MNTRLTHLRLLVENFSECEKFYRDVMRFEPRFTDGQGVYQEFDTGTSVIIALFGRAMMAEVVGTDTRPSSADAQDTVAFCFQVPDVDEAFRSLRTSDIDFVTEPHDEKAWMIRVAHFRDPAGNLIEINAPLK